MLLFSKILLCVMPLSLALHGNTVHAAKQGTCASSAHGDHQDMIEKICADSGEDKWPTCRSTFSTFLLKPDGSPLVGQTSCDDGCSLSSGFSCASKIATCVSPCTSSPTSNQCIDCVAQLGSCCDCLAYAVGKASDSAGQFVCDICPAAQSLKGDTPLESSPEEQMEADTLGELILTTTESKNALQIPTDANYLPYLAAVLGCKIYDVPCLLKGAKCNICKKAIPKLLGLGSEVACDAGCAVAVLAAGGGPEDPLADIVAASCPAICAAAYRTATGSSASAICKVAHVC